jgi:hypothetical protein
MKTTFTLLNILLSFLATGCYEAKTEFNHPQLARRFELVRVGDAVEKVYENIGPPLFIDVNPDKAGSGAYRQESFGRTDLASVLSVSSETNKELYLTYSQPQRAGQNYVLYAVYIREGKVFRKIGPSYQD